MSTHTDKMEMKIPSMPIANLSGYANMTPTFLLKLVNLLQEPEFNKYVSWSEDGQSFIVRDQAGFSKHVLPKYFKHNKFASFVRQLNMYGFRKVTTIQQGSLDLQQESIEFLHPFFKRDEEGLLQYIKRKVTQTNKTEELTTVLDDMHDIKSTQSNISVQLSELKRENEDLWREVVALRQKHAHQQKVVNRLIQFLVSLVKHHGGVGMKRPLQLMIEAGSADEAPFPKLSRTEEVNDNALEQNIASNVGSTSEGPLITELLSNKPTASKSAGTVENFITTDQTYSTNAASKQDMPNYISSPADAFSPDANVNSENIDQLDTNLSDNFLPTSSFATSAEDTDSHTVDDLLKGIVGPDDNLPSQESQNLLSTPNSNQLALSTTSPPQKIHSNIDLIENNLHSIKRRLSNNQQVKLDYDLIQELFNNSVDITPSPNVFEPSVPAEPSGNELVQYTGNEFLPAGSATNDDDITVENLDDFLSLLEE
uniref:HSF protein n=1 Tax=Phallusia mammillata TaxID=59560 RepID=A0A6F9DCP4_9ASCI|nr:HSF protein [Phallusia mammillata]